MVNCKGSKYGDRIGVIGKRNRDIVDEDWNQNASASTGKDHTDEFVGDWSRFWHSFENLTAMQKSIPQHAHVKDFLLMEEEKVGDLIVEHPSSWIYDWFRCFFTHDIAGW